MWRLRVATGDSPFLTSVSDFPGRQTWEFDPAAGTEEERREVERLREEFTRNRQEQKHSSDALMRLQVGDCNECDQEFRHHWQERKHSSDALMSLQVLGVYDYRGINPMPPEMWLLPYFLPMHPGRMWCHCRMVYLPMCYIYGLRAHGPTDTPLVAALREELYNEPYESINWNNMRRRCAK
ncbi:unnamed protein product, partial [Closterium sp. NIES-53]